MDDPVQKKCKVGRCYGSPLSGNIMCKEHWMMVPWQMRRYISKYLRKCDMVRDSMWEQLMSEAFWHVQGILKKKKEPPLPADPPGGFRW